MAISPEDAIKKFEVELLQELPLDDPIFFAMAKRFNLFPADTGNTIRAEKSRAHKVDYFLQHVVEPAAEHYLPRLLQLMKESKIANVEKLADDIQKAIAPGMYFRMFNLYSIYYLKCCYMENTGQSECRVTNIVHCKAKCYICHRTLTECCTYFHTVLKWFVVLYTSHKQQRIVLCK